MTQEKKLELLVVEDTPEFIEVAKSAYDRMGNINAHYVSTYEEAINYLENNKVDMVVSDLFFPTQTDFNISFKQDAKQGLQQIETWAKTYQNWDKIRIENYLQEERTTFEKWQTRFNALKEIPSGLEIARYCSNKKIPFCIASQGDRHGGDIATVRLYACYMLELSKDLGFNVTFKGFGDFDPFPDISVYDAGRVDKYKTQTWVDCIKTAYKIRQRQEESWKIEQ